MNQTLELISSYDTYQIKALTETDLTDMLKLCENNTTYYQYMKMKPTKENLLESIHAVPANKSIEDKLFIGFYQDHKLIAILDLIFEYPDAHTAFLGWLIIDKDYQHSGIGTEIIHTLISYLKKLRFKYIRLGCIKDNVEGKRFWLKNGFVFTGAESESEDYTILVMQKDLTLESYHTK